jgi:hypothetical protein
MRKNKTARQKRARKISREIVRLEKRLAFLKRALSRVLNAMPIEEYEGYYGRG